MTVAFYFDHNVDRPIAIQLRRRGVDVLLLLQDATARLDDRGVLARATELRRVLVTQDTDFLGITDEIVALGAGHPGVVIVKDASRRRGHLIETLTVFALAGDPADFANRVLYV